MTRGTSVLRGLLAGTTSADSDFLGFIERRGIFGTTDADQVFLRDPQRLVAIIQLVTLARVLVNLGQQAVVRFRGENTAFVVLIPLNSGLA